MARNTIPKMYEEKIQERPDGMVAEVGQGGQKYNDLAQTLRLIEATKSVVFDIKEIVQTFGKNWKVSIKNNMKKRGINKVRIATNNNDVHIWTTKV